MFNLENYEDVDTRIHKFYEEYPDGAIITEQVMNDDEKGITIFKAIAYRTYADTQPSATGYARGVRKDRGVDAAFHYENCETSAIGRCLANLGLSAKGKRPSALEMAKVNDTKNNPAPIRVRTEEQKEFLKTTNPAAEIVWDTTLEPPADVVSAFDNAVDLVKTELKAEPIPQCKHGQMKLKEGKGPKGPYRGYTCPLPMSRKAEQCKAFWQVVDPSGRWSFRPEDEERL
jgi:hypothetical protein